MEFSNFRVVKDLKIDRIMFKRCERLERRETRNRGESRPSRLQIMRARICQLCLRPALPRPPPRSRASAPSRRSRGGCAGTFRMGTADSATPASLPTTGNAVKTRRRSLAGTSQGASARSGIDASTTTCWTENYTSRSTSGPSIKPINKE